MLTDFHRAGETTGIAARFENRDFVSRARDPDRGGEPADPRADDGDFHLVR